MPTTTSSSSPSSSLSSLPSSVKTFTISENVKQEKEIAFGFESFLDEACYHSFAKKSAVLWVVFVIVVADVVVAVVVVAVVVVVVVAVVVVLLVACFHSV